MGEGPSYTLPLGTRWPRNKNATTPPSFTSSSLGARTTPPGDLRKPLSVRLCSDSCRMSGDVHEQVRPGLIGVLRDTPVHRWPATVTLRAVTDRRTRTLFIAATFAAIASASEVLVEFSGRPSYWQAAWGTTAAFAAALAIWCTGTSTSSKNLELGPVQPVQPVQAIQPAHGGPPPAAPPTIDPPASARPATSPYPPRPRGLTELLSTSPPEGGDQPSSRAVPRRRAAYSCSVKGRPRALPLPAAGVLEALAGVTQSSPGTPVDYLHGN